MSTYSVLRRMVVAACACIVALTIFFGTAHANGDTVKVPFTIDCSQVPDTPAARRALAQYNLCGYGNTKGGAVAKGTVWGDCGTLTIIASDAGGGYAEVYVRITSNYEPMVAASYGTVVYNERLNLTRHTTGAFAGAPRAAWSDTKEANTGTGWVIATVTYAKTILQSGLTCRNSSFPNSRCRVT